MRGQEHNLPRATWHTFYARVPNGLARIFHSIPVLSSKYFWNFLLFGLPTFIIFNFGYFNSWAPTPENLPILVSIYIASSWIWLGPLLTLAWEEAYDKFVHQIRQYADDNQLDISGFESKLRYWRVLPLVFGLLYVAMGLYLHASYRPLIADFMNIPMQSVVFYTTNVVLILSGYVTGIGVAGVVHTIILYLSLNKVNFRWEPFHPDQRGGLAFLSGFALTTSTLFLGGVTVVPAMMSMAVKVGGVEALAGYAAIFVYALFIASIFFWPMAIISEKAAAEKQEFLVGLSHLISSELEKLSAAKTNISQNTSAIINESTVQMIDLYDRVKEVSVHPYSSLTLLKVVRNTLLPLFFAAAQIFIENSDFLDSIFRSPPP